MQTPAYALFDTPIGRCAVAWADRGLIGVQLPEPKSAQTLARVERRFPDAVETTAPADVRHTIDAMTALLRGEARDLTDVALDVRRVSPFHQRVYAVARTIPPGRTLTYGDVAERLGDRGLARAVGVALGRNPFPIIVPCHRVLAAGGKIGGFSAGGGITLKLRMLSIEGAHANAQAAADARANGSGDLFSADGRYGFDPQAAVAHLRRVDPTLRRLIDRVGAFEMEMKHAPSLFVALAEAIVYQQLHGKAAATIFARLRALFPNGHRGPTPEQILRASEARLLGAGLSRAKLASLKDLAQRTAIGEVPTLAEAATMSDDELIERLTQVRGIGRWTVEMLLIFRLGRPDVLPADDFGIRKGFSIAFDAARMPPPKDVLTRGARWAPYRTVASWYLWRAAEL